MKKRVLAAVVILVVLGVTGVALLRESRSREMAKLKVSGNIEIDDVALSFQIPGRVIHRYVAEGAVVTNGQPVAALDPVEFEQELALRKAEVRAAEALLAELEAGSRPEEIDQAAAAAEAAHSELRAQANEYARQRELLQRKIISSREFEVAEAAHSMAQARLREAAARLALLRQGPRRETIAAARAKLEQARQAAALAATRLDRAVLAAPCSGLVLAEGVEEGEYVAPGTPVVTVGDLARVWLRGYVAESDLGRVKVGQPVDVTTDAAPDRIFRGNLIFIAQEAEFTPKNVQTVKERVKLVYRVKIDIPNPEGTLKPGMPADGVIVEKGGQIDQAGRLSVCD